MHVASNRTILGINFLHIFLFSALAILLPLYLAEKGVGLGEIGLILSVLPLVMLVVRTALAVLADAIGTRMVFLTNATGILAATVTYLLAPTAIFFSIGKVLEGIGHSAYWSVIRTEIYRHANGKEAQQAAYMEGWRGIADFGGKILAGTAIFYIGFTSALAFLLIPAVLLWLMAFRIPHNGKRDRGWRGLASVWKRRPIAFWKAALLMVLAVVFLDMATVFLFPLYLHQIGMDILGIGAVLAVYALFSGAATLWSVRKRWSVVRLAAGSIFLGAVPLALIPGADAVMVLPLFIVLALGNGMVSNVFERVIAHATKQSKAVSTDIAVLHIPFRAAEFLALAGIGFFVGAFGFASAFWVVAIAMAVFAISCIGFLNVKIH